MNPILKQFYDTGSMREVVKAFLIETLKEQAVEQVFNKKAVAGLYEGKKAIERGFEKLEELYGRREETIISNSR